MVPSLASRLGLLPKVSSELEGVDFDETFANTAGKTTVRVFFAIITVLGLHVRQVDVTTAFLYGHVDKEIYVRQPPGHDDGSGRVCKLKRALYGLKQAPRIWQETLRASLLRLGFVTSKMDPSLYVLSKDGQLVLLLDFVDDMLIASSNKAHVNWVFDELCKEYKITDEGEPQKYVGFYVRHDRTKGEMWVHQAPYIMNLLEKHGVSVTSHPDTPLPHDWVLEHPWEADGSAPPKATKVDVLLDNAGCTRFQQIVGSLNYVAHATRPDIGFAVNQLSRVSSRPRERHMAAARACCQVLGWHCHFGPSLFQVRWLVSGVLR